MLLALLLSPVLAFRPVPQGTEATSPEAAAIDAYLRRCVPFGFSGQLVVEREGEVLLDGSYGQADREAGTPVTADTAFGAASMTKPFVAAAILLLQQEERLRVDEPASRYVSLPEDKQGILLSQLLTHTSGLPYSVASDDWEVTDPAEVARRLRSAPLESAPGARWEYSNTGYNLLVEVIEAVTGRPYEDFVRERLLLPAGMTRSGFLHGAAPIVPPLARCVWREHDEGDPRAWPLDAVLRGAGDLFTTAGDLRRWEQALRAGSILAPETVAELLAPRVAIQERVDYGFGWFHYRSSDGVRMIEHGGDWKRGYNGLTRRYPERGLCLFLTCSQRLASGTWVRAPLQDALDEFLVRGKPLPMPPETIAVSAERLEAYCGDFGEDPGVRVRVRRDADRLRVEARGQHAAALLLGTSERAEEAGWAAAEGVAAFLKELAADPEGVLAARLEGQEAARSLFLARWRAQVARIGVPTAFQVLAGIPGPSGTTQVAAELRGPRGTAIALVYWAGDAFAGLDLDRSFTDLILNFALESATSAVCHDLGDGSTSRLAFDLDADGRPRALRLPGTDADAWLSRVAR